MEAEPERRQRRHALSANPRQRRQSTSIRTIPRSVGPIVPVVIGLPAETVQAGRHLENAGFLVAAIRPPTVPRGTSRLRISLTCGHGEEDLERLAQTLTSVRRAA